MNIVNYMAADGMATLGAKASQALELTWFCRNNLDRFLSGIDAGTAD